LSACLHAGLIRANGAFVPSREHCQSCSAALARANSRRKTLIAACRDQLSYRVRQVHHNFITRSPIMMDVERRAEDRQPAISASKVEGLNRHSDYPVEANPVPGDPYGTLLRVHNVDPKRQMCSVGHVRRVSRVFSAHLNLNQCVHCCGKSLSFPVQYIVD
jgi:hypothetical protein